MSESVLTKRLLKFGVRPTRQRIQLADLLFGDGKARHFTAESLYEEAQKSGYSLSQATVYNSVHAFCHAGLIREVAVEGHVGFYDTKTDAHPHFYLEETGELIDAHTDAVHVEYCGEIPEGMTINGIDVVIRLRRLSSH